MLSVNVPCPEDASFNPNVAYGTDHPSRKYKAPSCAWSRFGEKNGRELVAAQMMAPVEFINIIVYA
jgi:hypothetical protein